MHKQKLAPFGVLAAPLAKEIITLSPVFFIAVIIVGISFILNGAYIVRFTENYFSIALGLVQAMRSTNVLDHTMNTVGSLGNSFFMTNAALVPSFRIAAIFPEGIRMAVYYAGLFSGAVFACFVFFRACGFSSKSSLGSGLMTAFFILPVGGWAVAAYWPLIYWPPLVSVFSGGLVFAALVIRSADHGPVNAVLEGTVQGLLLLWMLLAFPYMAGALAVFCLAVYLWRLAHVRRRSEVLLVLGCGAIAASASFIPCAGGLRAMADSSIRLIGAAHHGYPNHLSDLEAWGRMAKLFLTAPHVTRVHELHGPPVLSFINPFLYWIMPFVLLAGAAAFFKWRNPLTRIYLLCAIMWIAIRAFDVFHSAFRVSSFNSGYLETFLLPVHLTLVFCTLERLARRRTGARDSYWPAVVLCSVLLVYASRLNASTRSTWTGYKEVRNPSVLAAILRKEVALRPEGEQFRGRVLNMAHESPLWRKEHEQAGLYALDNTSALATGGADFRWSLFYESIPVLCDVGNFLSPFTVVAVDRLCAHHDPVSPMLQFLSFQIPDPRLLRAMGVRYLITGTPLENQNFTLKCREQLGVGLDFYLYELSGANVFNYSPTAVDMSTSMEEILKAMSRPSFDFAKHVYVESDVHGPFAPASGSMATIRNDVIYVTAHAKGRSIVLLPLEYSHCLEMKVLTRHPLPTALVRANGFMAAIIFSGPQLKAELRYRFNPLDGRGKHRDFIDAVRYGVAESLYQMEMSTSSCHTYKPLSERSSL